MAVVSKRKGEREPAGSSRDRLLRAIEARFAVSGFSGTRLVDVAEDAELTTGAFYSYFPGKAAAFHVLYDRFAADFTTELVGANDLEAYCVRWIDCQQARAGAVRASEEVAREDKAFLDHLSRYRQLWAGAAMPHLPGHLDPATLRLVANLTVDILDYQSFARRHEWSDVTPAEIAANLSSLLTSGLYLRSVKGVGPPRRDSAEPAGPDEPNPLGLMTWKPSAGRADPSSRRGQANRTGILDAAGQVFSEVGYNNCSIAMVAQRAGVSPATAYRYFSDKNDIFRCLLSAVKDELYASALILLDDEGRMVVEPAVLQYLKVRREYAAVYRVWRELLEPGSEMEETWIWIRRDFQHRIARIVAFGQRGGLITPHYTPEVVAELLVAAFDGPSHTRFDLSWDETLRDRDFAQVLGSIFGMGFVTEPGS